MKVLVDTNRVRYSSEVHVALVTVVGKRSMEDRECSLPSKRNWTLVLSATYSRYGISQTSAVAPAKEARVFK